MIRQLDAVYEKGRLRPLEPLALTENQSVRLIVVDSANPDHPATVNERREELQWLSERSAPYAGQWVALEGDRLISHGDDLQAVRAAARAAGVERPLLTHLPELDELPFGGW